MAEKSKNKRWKSQIKKLAALGGAVFGALMGKYSGMAIAAPAFMFILFYFLIKKFIKKDKKCFFIETSSLLFAHALWMLSGIILFYMRNGRSFETMSIVSASEASVYIIIAVFILVKPLKPAIISLITLETCFIVYNLINIFSIESGSSEHKALTVHILLRACIIIYASLGLKKWNKFSTEIRKHNL